MISLVPKYLMINYFLNMVQIISVGGKNLRTLEIQKQLEKAFFLKKFRVLLLDYPYLLKIMIILYLPKKYLMKLIVLRLI